MEIIDIVLIGLLVVGGVRGFKKGLIDQVVSIAALLLGIWVAIRFSDFTANLLTTKFNFTSEYISVIAFVITFAAAVVGVHFVGKLAEKLVNMVALGFVNRIAGFAVGILLWGFILSVVLSIIDKFSLVSDETKQNSIVYKPLSKVAPAVFPYLKFDKLKDGFNKLTNPDDEGTNVNV